MEKVLCTNTDAIRIELAHEVEEAEFNLHRAEVLARLRFLTGIPTIGLTSERVEAKQNTKLFTPQDKFEYLAAQNPLLRKLKTDLDLDITY